MRRPYNIAHQGASGLAPSNTLAAFDRAVQEGADWIEIDVVTTADGVVVVSHDTTVDRYTNGHGAIDRDVPGAGQGAGCGRPLRPAVRRPAHPHVGGDHRLGAPAAHPSVHRDQGRLRSANIAARRWPRWTSCSAWTMSGPP